MQNIIAIENGVVRHPLYRMKKPINMTLAEGEHIAIVGPNGAGKSILVDLSCCVRSVPAIPIL